MTKTHLAIIAGVAIGYFMADSLYAYQPFTWVIDTAGGGAQ